MAEPEKGRCLLQWPHWCAYKWRFFKGNMKTYAVRKADLTTDKEQSKVSTKQKRGFLYNPSMTRNKVEVKSWLGRSIGAHTKPATIPKDYDNSDMLRACDKRQIERACRMPLLGGRAHPRW